MIGRTLSDRYVVEAVVGTGGMAVVYRAYDKIRKRTVAIKVLRPEYESDEEFVRRFSREAEAASKVSHENIVNMLDVGIDGEVRYIVMEFVDGQTLKELIREKGRIPPDQALRMTIRILAAVDHAHRNGIVHRDIKPQNILVDRQGRVKVADFGIARLKTEQKTQLDENGASALGSVHYFSPEQARGEVADEKSDLYSVGVVMYEMLTGHVPFDGETSVSVALKHVSEAPKSMRLFQGGISKALDEVVMRALSKDASQRYQTAAEMAADLRKTVTHPRGGFVKYPLNPEEQERQREARRRRRQKLRRRWMITGLVVVVLAAIVALLGAGWYYFFFRNRVQVPYLIGEQQQTALETLEQAELPATIERAYSEDYEAGMVLAQSRKPGERIRRGSSVTLVVSAGTQWYELENLTGQYEADALDWLAVQGAADVTVEYVQDEAPVGEVVAQSLEPGAQSKDAPLTLTVSGRTVLMPPLTGLTLEGATALLQSEGLVLGEVTEGESPDAPAHTVIAQNIAPNSQVLAGTAIDLTLCAGRETIYRPDCEFTVMVPLDNLEVVVTVTAPSGTETIVFSQKLPAGAHAVSLSSAEPGEHTVRVYLDGVLMDTTQIVFS